MPCSAETGAPLDYRADGSDDEARAGFLAAGQRLLPTLRDEDLAPGQVGYRPKLSDAGEDAADFLLWHDRGYVHLGGIESRCRSRSRSPTCCAEFLADT